MTYNFDQSPDRRGTESVKWDLYPGTLPLWVADMDFKVAPEKWHPRFRRPFRSA